jgi:hypothetical protein
MILNQINTLIKHELHLSFPPNIEGIDHDGFLTLLHYILAPSKTHEHQIVNIIQQNKIYPTTPDVNIETVETTDSSGKASSTTSFFPSNKIRLSTCSQFLQRTNLQSLITAPYIFQISNNNANSLSTYEDIPTYIEDITPLLPKYVQQLTIPSFLHPNNSLNLYNVYKMHNSPSFYTTAKLHSDTKIAITNLCENYLSVTPKIDTHDPTELLTKLQYKHKIPYILIAFDLRPSSEHVETCCLDLSTLFIGHKAEQKPTIDYTDSIWHQFGEDRTTRFKWSGQNGIKHKICGIPKNEKDHFPCVKFTVESLYYVNLKMIWPYIPVVPCLQKQYHNFENTEYAKLYTQPEQQL